MWLFDSIFVYVSLFRLALANEKRRKRRESHNAVERRRRDNINEKIQELALLLPEEWLETAGNPTGGTTAKNGSVSGGSFGQGPSLAGLLSGTVSGSALVGDDDSKEIKANKGVILRNSVEYIKSVLCFSSLCLNWVLNSSNSSFRNLVQLVQVQRSRNDQLESELAQYRNRFGSINGSSNGRCCNCDISLFRDEGLSLVVSSILELTYFSPSIFSWTIPPLMSMSIAFLFPGRPPVSYRPANARISRVKQYGHE
jgi:hypothetical protein